MRDEPLDLVDSWYCNVSGHTTLAAPDQDSLVAAITALVAQRAGEERERCAVICDEQRRFSARIGNDAPDPVYFRGKQSAAEEIAAAIRSQPAPPTVKEGP